MTAQFLIGCGAGFSGDRIDAPIPVVRDLVRRRRPSAIFFETLGERTLALAQLRRLEDPDEGHEPLLEELLRPVLADCLDADIAMIGNFGAANPAGAARRIAGLCAAAGFPDAPIGVVEGDEVTALAQAGRLAPASLDSALQDRPLICANAYLGAEPLIAALAQGARILVTGRVADPSLAVAPLAHHFSWAPADCGRMATATLAGHLLECGAQITGGYFADPGWKDVPDLHRAGFPIAEVTAEGGLTIGKPADTGGLVSEATVKEQLLYEIHDPSSYLTPDVTLDMTGVTLRAEGPDRVAVFGARGRARPERLKVTVSVDGGYLGEGEISYAGPNAVGRARLALDVLARRVPQHLRLRSDIIGYRSVFADEGSAVADVAGDSGFPAGEDVRARIAVESDSAQEAEAAVREVVALLCCGPAGGGGARTQVRRRVHTWSATAPRADVNAGVCVRVAPAWRWREASHD